MAMGCKHQVNMIYNTGYRLSVNNACSFNRLCLKAQPITANLSYKHFNLCRYTG